MEEGFGDYFLALRDRDAERRALEKAQRQAEHARMRAETSLLVQLQRAVTERDERRYIEAYEDALSQQKSDAIAGGLEALFSAGAEPTFVAAALRPHLRQLTLRAEQWLEVAIGGALLENHAIRDVALSKAKEDPSLQWTQLNAAIANAAPSEKRNLEPLLAAR